MKQIFLATPHMSEEGFEQKYIQEAFDTNWIAPLGENVTQLEREVCQKVNANGAVALSSGTAGLHMALKACDVKEGDIVICQSLTFAASVNPILYEKAIPVFVDSDEESWNMDPALLEEALIKYPQAKAVIVVHLYGLCAEMDKIVNLCEKYQVSLIEDAAESLGATYHGKHTGTFGRFGIYSFNGNKIITTSGGGMVVSKEQERLDKILFWATQSREKEVYYQHEEIGYNYRLSNICAGIGRGQLKVLDRRIEKKKSIYEFYQEHLSDLSDISFMPALVDTKPNYWLSVIRFKKTNPETIRKALANKMIESRPVWKPMHLQPVFEKYDFFGTDVSGNLFRTGLCLPSDTKMTQDDLERVVKVIRKEYRDDL